MLRWKAVRRLENNFVEGSGGFVMPPPFSYLGGVAVTAKLKWMSENFHYGRFEKIQVRAETEVNGS